MNKPAPIILSEAPALSLEGKHLPRPMKAQKTMHDPGRRAQREPSLARRRAVQTLRGWGREPVRGAFDLMKIARPHVTFSSLILLQGLDFFEKKHIIITPLIGYKYFSVSVYLYHVF